MNALERALQDSLRDSARGEENREQSIMSIGAREQKGMGNPDTHLSLRLE